MCGMYMCARLRVSFGSQVFTLCHARLFRVGIYVVCDLALRVCYQKCHDVDCKGERSPGLPIPDWAVVTADSPPELSNLDTALLALPDAIWESGIKSDPPSAFCDNDEALDRALQGLPY